MRYFLVLSLFTIIYSFNSYANTISNKGLLCEKTDVSVKGLGIWERDDVVGFGFFEKGKIEIWLIDVLDDNGNGFETELVKRDDISEGTTYKLLENELMIFLKYKYVSINETISINRYDLSMKKNKKRLQCELFSNKSKFRKKVRNFGKEKLKNRKF